MKYEVEISQTAYGKFTVEADSEDEAETIALQKAAEMGLDDSWSGYTVESIGEVE